MYTLSSRGLPAILFLLFLIRLLLGLFFFPSVDLNQIKLAQFFGINNYQHYVIFQTFTWAGFVLSLLLFAKKLQVKNLQLLAFILICSPWVNSLFTYGGRFEPDHTIFSELKRDKLTSDVNLAQKEIFLSVNKEYSLPTWFRKITYNKVTLAADLVSHKIIGSLDLLAWTKPLEAWEITQFSGIPPRGVLPIFYWWEIMIIVYCWYKGRRKSFWMQLPLFVGLIIMSIFPSKFFLYTASFFVVYSYYLISMSIENTKSLTVLISLFYIISSLSLWNKLFFRQNDFSLPHPLLYKQMANYIKSSTGSFVITDRIGPTKVFMNFYSADRPNTTYRQIEPNEEAVLGTTYIGLPKEIEDMVSPNVIHKISADNETVYKYGKGIWVAQ
jgi:hypothetical protein